jgi:predicted nucleic acid-binding protein
LSFLSSVSTSLDEGERTAVALALEIRPDVFLSDDRAARGEANRRGLKWLATVDVIYLLKQYNLIPAVKPVLDTMRRNGFGIKRTLYRTTLRKSGE